jgi:hypothetical protein
LAFDAGTGSRSRWSREMVMAAATRLDNRFLNRQHLGDEGFFAVSMGLKSSRYRCEKSAREASWLKDINFDMLFNRFLGGAVGEGIDTVVA